MPRNNGLSPEVRARRNAAIAEDYKAGLPMEEIRRRHDVARATAREIVREMGLPPRHYGAARKDDRPLPLFTDPDEGSELCYSCGAWVLYVNDDNWCPRCAFNYKHGGS